MLRHQRVHHVPARPVSMKSGLEGRNNLAGDVLRQLPFPHVSMKSGLEGRNNVGGSFTKYWSRYTSQ